MSVCLRLSAMKIALYTVGFEAKSTPLALNSLPEHLLTLLTAFMTEISGSNLGVMEGKC